MSYKPEHEAIYEKYGLPQEKPEKPKSRIPGWLKAAIMFTVLIVALAGVFQVNPVCGVLLFLLIPIASNL